MNIFKGFFTKNINEIDYIAELKAKISELEKERQELKFQLNENELEYKDTLIQYESKIEKLTEENLFLNNENNSFSIKLSQILSICKDFENETDPEETEIEDF